MNNFAFFLVFEIYLVDLWELIVDVLLYSFLFDYANIFEDVSNERFPLFVTFISEV